MQIYDKNGQEYDADLAEGTDLRELRAENQLLISKLVTCGVIATHPDSDLGNRHPYSTIWDSQQAERVRQLRAQAERMRFLLSEVVRCVPIIASEWRQTHLFAQCEAAVSSNTALQTRRRRCL